ncbi:MAG: hypothetical protein GY775_12480 [Candidatus Scalindua sp.]|nr:hypothetical protein [Candidatus Scalindua sp.]
MEDILTISKENPAEKSMDYEFLREEGFKHIESLGSKIWTDYNVHDPGINILEVLCYAITDLGYRSSFDIKDILTEPDDSKNLPQFFTASEVLTCNPVTENDFRKVIVDTDRVKNAWINIAESTNPKIYINCEDSILEYTGDSAKDLPLRGLYDILLELDDDVDLSNTATVNAIKASVAERLHNVRNLCEDYLSINVVGIEKISLCSDIEVDGDAEIEEVLAEIYLRIHQFISPTINSYTLEELLDKGKKSEEIFDGPFLEHGFIDTEELEATILPKELHVSDLHQIIMEVSGVKSIKKLFVLSYDNNDNRVASEEWCLPLHPPLFKAQLSTELSSITFYKELIPLEADKEKVREMFEFKLGMAKKNDITRKGNDFEIPTGTYYDLKDYTSVQEEFPLTYGIGSEGLPDSVDDLRKAQAKQLKGYLTFFDQLLANYLAQLSNVKDLLSVHNTNDRTYFANVLYEVPDIKALLMDYASATDWETFKSNQTNGYVTKLKKYLEDDFTKWNRRNRFLDHLMARFGERFNDYAMLMYDIYGNKVNENLVKDKEDFLRDYPVVSRDRGKAFNYKAWDEDKKQPDVWDTNNVSGLEARIARLLGIHDYSRRRLYCEPVYTVKVYKLTSGPQVGKFNFRIRDAEGNIIMVGTNPYVKQNKAEEIVEILKAQLLNEESYKVKTVNGNKYKLSITKDGGSILAESKSSFDSDKDAVALKEKILKMACPEEDCGKEGFHLIENILLRPHDKDYHPLPVNVECGGCNENADPYSFRISIVLPYWPKNFQKWTFRKFFEETIRKETPAHIAVKICWVSCLQMREFEEVYKKWLQEKAKKKPKKETLRDYTNDLINTLISLKNVHREAKLHDCKTSKDALILGYSKLGQL